MKPDEDSLGHAPMFASPVAQAGGVHNINVASAIKAAACPRGERRNTGPFTTHLDLASVINLSASTPAACVNDLLRPSPRVRVCMSVCVRPRPAARGPTHVYYECCVCGVK